LQDPVEIAAIVPHLEHIIKSQAASSILWVLLRTVPEPELCDEHEEVFQATFKKEFSAATQTIFSMYPEMDYTYLSTAAFQIPHHLRPPWANRSLAMVPYIVNRMARSSNLLPRVNRTKNVSRPTAKEYLLYRPGKSVSEVRTVDLEVLYGETGVKIGGPCEMRQSWKFNELKPRLYYCKGGLAHHKSKYIKDITIAIMDSLDITHVDNRRRPWEFIECDEDDHIVYWDLTAFTSTLSELKHYLHALANAIEDYGERPLFAVDYKLGLIEISLSETIRQYSECVNHLHPITITRLLHKFIDGDDYDDLDYTMVNSGPLGVDGNIGLSTSNHGYGMLHESEGPKKDVNVGDDGLSCRKEHPSIGLYPRLRSIGNLHPDKEGIIPAYDWNTVGKFLKRRLERVEGGIWISSLLSLPLPNLVDGEYGFRTPSPDSDHDRILKIMKTIGSLMWSITGDCPGLTSRDYRLISIYLREIYHRVGASPEGSLEGFRPNKHACFSQDSCGMVRLAYPPIVFDNRFEPWRGDWLLYLLARDGNISRVTAPVLTSQSRVEKPYQDDILFCPSRGEYQVLEDLGYVVTEEIKEVLDLSIEANRDKFVAHVRGDRRSMVPLVRMHVLEPIPERFDFMFVTPYLFGADTLAMY
jgi:hypothetical protein